MLSERKWKGEAVLLLLMGVLILAPAFKSIWEFSGAAGFFSGVDKRVLSVVVNTMAFQGMALVLIGLFIRLQHLSWKYVFGFGADRKMRTIWLGLIAGCCVLPTAWLLQSFSARLLDWLSMDAQAQELVRDIQEVTRSSAGGSVFLQNMLFGLSVIVIAPVVEEMLFRGLLYPTLKELGFPRLALWGTAVLFALLHWNGPGFLSFVFLGAVLAYVYEATDNLLASILTHSVFNTVNFLYMLNENAVNRVLKQFP
jgi:membrane protease YdiL (CAAX protease family)